MSEENSSKLIKAGGIILLAAFIAYVGYRVVRFLFYDLGISSSIYSIVSLIFWPAFYAIIVVGLTLVVVGSFLGKKILLGVGAIIWAVNPAYSLNMEIMDSTGLLSGLPSSINAVFFIVELVILFAVLAALIIFTVHENTAGDKTKMAYVVVSLVFYCIMLFNYFSGGLVSALLDELAFGIDVLEDLFYALLMSIFRFYILFMGVYFVNEGKVE